MAERPSQMTEKERRELAVRERRRWPVSLAGGLVIVAGMIAITQSWLLGGLMIAAGLFTLLVLAYWIR